MRIQGERSIEHNQALYLAFVDFEKAFDRVNWIKLMEIVKSVGVDWRDRKLICELSMGLTATVRTSNGESEPAEIGRGVRQGCLVSPSLFNNFAEVMATSALQGCEEGVKLGGYPVKAVRSADDQGMLADSENGLQKITDRLNNVVDDFRMKMNVKKTKAMKKLVKKLWQYQDHVELAET